jgi:hypothetical protein
MNATPVLALVSSRLAADVIMIRLRRVGVEHGKISVVFPRRFTPNTVACWLDVAQNPIHASDREPVLAAGPLRVEFAKSGNSAPIADLIERAGFDHRVSAIVEHRLQFGDTLLCVHAEGEAEASIAWHVFKHSMAEMIAVGGSQAEAGVEDVEPAEPISAPHWSAAA